MLFSSRAQFTGKSAGRSYLWILLQLVVLSLSFSFPSTGYGYNLSGQNLGANGDGAGASSAWNSANHLALSYIRSGTFHVVYREFDGSTWNEETAYAGLNQLPRHTVNGSMTVDSSTALVFRNGNPHIFFFDSATGSLRVAYRSAAVWVSDVVDASAGGSPSAAACGSSICLSYFAQSTRDLKFARGFPGSWSKQTVDGASGDVGGFNKIAVTSANKAVIGYYDSINRTLKVATEGSSAWGLQTLPYLNHSYGMYPSIAVGSDGSIHLAASRFHSDVTGPELGLYYAVKRNGAWDVSIIADDYAGGSTALVLNAANLPTIVYHYRRFHSQFGNEDSIEVREQLSSGIWKAQRVSGEYGASGAHYRFDSISVSRDSGSGIVVAAHFAQEAYSSYAAKSGVRLFSDPSQPFTGGGSGGGGGGGGGGPDSDNDGVTDSDELSRGTNPYANDSDGDGVDDGQEIIDGSNPLDRGSRMNRRGSTFCSEWNGFLTGPTGSMWNILELVSQSAGPLNVTLSLQNSAGQTISERNVSVLPGAQTDVLVHDMPGRVENAYGRVCLSHNGQSGDLDGRMVYYRVNLSSQYEFAFAMPFTGGKGGAQYVPFNTYQPSLNSQDQGNFVANWIQLSNQGTGAAAGTLTFFDMGGAVIGQVRVDLPVGSRVDQSGHQFGANKVGLVEWVPDNSSMNVQMRNVRYYYDNPAGADKFSSAFQLEAQPGTGETIAVAVETEQSTAVVEVANVLAAAVGATIKVYNEGGTLVQEIGTAIAPKASHHFIINDLLGSGQKGVVIVSGDRPNALIVTGMEYGRAANGGLSFVYGMNAEQALGSVLRGSYNTYLNQDSNLVLVNPTDSATTTAVRLIRSTGVSVLESLNVLVPAHGRKTIRLNDYESAENYGIVEVQSDPGTIIGTVLRYRSSDFVIPTPLRE